MGIPRYAKTLMTRYPLIVENIRNESDIPKIDNLYLDLNSTIHELSHSNSMNILALLKNKSYEEIYEQTCELINQILELIKPSSLLMISLDGVSPVAKISNQLSSRYSKSFCDSKEINEFFGQLNLEKKNIFDKNEISPCTDFMINFEKYLDNYIQKKLKEKANVWANINIILSGTNVPGEGEYKIMEQIREEKSKENNKNIRHCIFSGDSDFILLSLLIHEADIVILKGGTSTNSNKYNFEFNKENNSLYFNELIYISVLREFLDIEFCKLKTKIKFGYNIERIYDDFVLLCLLFGNDFIPGLLKLDTDGIVYELLLDSYKISIQKCGDYLTNDGIINFNSFKIFINELSLRESEYLNLKYDYFKRIINSKKFNNSSSLIEIYKNECKIDNNISEPYERLKYAMNSFDTLMKKIINVMDNTVMFKDKEYSLELNKNFFHNFVEEYNNDKYKGKKLYYKKKFNIDIEDESGKQVLKDIITNYLEGLQWNLYYYKGYLFWNWNYMYDYCPLLSDIAKYDYKNNINEIINNNINQFKGDPLPPYILLCLILPSFKIIPENYHKIDEIIPDYYEYEKYFDNNGSPLPSQITVSCPKVEGKEMIKKLIDFDNQEFPKTKNYQLIKENYGKEYLYNINNIKIEYNRKRKNEIFKENYDKKEVDLLFPSIESISNYKYIEGYFTRSIGKNKIIQINSLFIYIYLDEKIYKKFNKSTIDNIFKEKIISYGYPQIKLGLLKGLYYNNKYYSINQEKKILTDTPYLFDYEEQIKKDYEFIGLKILDLSCLIEVIPIIGIDNDKFIFDYEYKYLIPLEITSLNITNKIHQEFLNNSLKMNNINYNDIKFDKEISDKEKEVFLYDISLRKNKNNAKEKSDKNINKFKGKKGDKKKKKSKGPVLEREITNFKFKVIDDY